MKSIVYLFLIILISGCSDSISREGNSSPDDMADLIHQVKSNQAVFIEGKVFEGKIDLHQLGMLGKISSRTSASIISVPIYFKNCTFSGGIRSYADNGDRQIITIFEGLGFENCTFEGEVDLTGAHFRSPTHWQNNIFRKGIKINGATFEQNFSFQSNSVHGNWTANQADFRGKADFFESSFNNVSFFQGVQFNGTANFAKCSFLQNTDFTMIRARENLFFSYAHFSERSWFNGADWQGIAEFHKTKFDGEASFDRILSRRKPDFRNTNFSVTPQFQDFSVTVTKNYITKLNN